MITDFSETLDEVGWDNAVAPDGRYLVAGGAYLFDLDKSMVLRYNGANGSLDTSFSEDGKLFFGSYTNNYNVGTVAVDANFRVTVAGWMN